MVNLEQLHGHVICQDNLILLKSLPDECIDCSYNDILFNTHRTFKDFNDNLGDILTAVEFYRSRFTELRRILKSTGVLYIHCDTVLSHHIKILLDEVFSSDQFRNEIIWWYNSAPRKKKDFGKRHDTIFRYSKTDNYWFNENSSYIRHPYSLTAPRGYEKEKYYDNRGKILDDVWKINMLGQNDRTERTGYSTQKPKQLLYPIIDSSCPRDGVFADFFCGSGTSLVVAKELGIKFIGCDINPKAVEISNTRLINTRCTISLF